MKKLMIPLLLGGAMLTMAFQGYQQQTAIPNSCKSSESRKAAKQELKPFDYDAGKTNTFTFRDKVQKREIEVPLFFGEKYRMVFNQDGLPEAIKIEVYDKKNTAKNRTLLFSNEGKESESMLVFEPEKSKKLYVNYTVPKTTGDPQKGCVVMVVGYKSRFKKEE